MRAFLAPLLGLLLLGGCSGMEPAPHCDMGRVSSQRDLVPGPAMIPGEPSPLKEMPLNSASIIDANIINKVHVRAITARRTATGTVEVVAQVVNCTDFPLNAEARTQFYDGALSPSEPASAWRRLALPARAVTGYHEFSIGAQTVEHYLIEMRETR
ncbi:hypothetical protein [Magnetospirillum sp. SS-4]|uniref:hypothetical protein n=1 Tax=Magnetospirillum sp. SS-4 TaxID=2681465 RepID=UPI00137D321D|nr:hypothetical protein [Magnetospirillum sp. SS-4]CAA7626319.1 conserved exported hypothetical protein [Magnetospirillum sp. SS-4]